MATNKQQIWLTEYLKCWNASEAARRANYKWPDKQGQELKIKLATEIKTYINEKIMSADEALILLADHARASLADFTDIKLFEDLKYHPKAHTLKRLTTDVYEDKAGKVHYKTNFEIVDSQTAVVNVLKIHSLFTDKIELKLEKEVESFLTTLEQSLDADTFQRVLQALSAGRNNPEISGATTTEDSG